MSESAGDVSVQQLREIIDAILPDEAIRRLVLETFADSIELANAGNPRSWSLKIKVGGGLQLFVSNPKVVEIGREGKFYLLVDNSDVTADVQACIDAVKHASAPPMPSDPQATRLLIPFNQLADVLPQVRAAHEKIILRNRKWGSFRPNEHSPVALQYLREETGRILPDSPHQGLGAEARIDPVRAAMEKVYPDPQIRTRIMNVVADSILLAHEGNPRSWALSFRDGKILRLNIGQIEAIIPGWFLTKDDPSLPLTVDLDGASPEELELLLSLIVDENPTYKSYPTARRIRLAADQIEAMTPEIISAHVRLITSVRSRNTPWMGSHSPKALQYVREVTGRDLPDPAYATDLTPAPGGAWKLSVGNKMANLKFLIDEQIMALEFDYIAFDINETEPVTKEAYREGLEKRGVPWDPAPNHGPMQLYSLLFDVKPGDRVYLYYARQIQASGVVAGDYEYEASAAGFRHRRRVEWDVSRVLSTAQMSSALKTKLEESYMALESLLIEQADEIDGIVPPPIDWPVAYRKLFANEGLHYTLWQQAVFFTALQAKGFVILSGISGTGKTKIAQAFSAALPQPDEGRNVEFLTVRPDWRDSKSLLGYHNPITDRYEWTPFLRFLLRARESWEQRDGLAWFVILDEMNLAHVEHYFAELLSLLESGRDSDGWTREAIQLPSNGDDDSPPASLKLPPNLHIIGTVNLDETTHAFSPKVLDRAFAMELVEVSFAGFPFAIANGASLDDRERAALLDAFSLSGTFPRIDHDAIAARIQDDARPRDWLDSLNQQLRPAYMHFGYRVFDEILAFVDLGMNNGLFAALGDQDDPLLAPFDAAVQMKVLPKFHGSRAKLEDPLIRVLGWCLDPLNPDTTTIRQVVAQVMTAEAMEEMLLMLPYQFPQTARRAIRLLRTAYVDGFAAFG